MRAGEPAIFIDDLVADDCDQASLNAERAQVRAQTRHRVGDQHEPVVPFRAQRDLQRLGMYVMPVDDEPAPGLFGAERRADRAWLARGQRRHGIEQVCEPAQPRAERRLQLLEAGIGMAGRHDHPGGVQRADQGGRGSLGCERDHGFPTVRRAQ